MKLAQKVLNILESDYSHPVVKKVRDIIRKVTNNGSTVNIEIYLNVKSKQIAIAYDKHGRYWPTKIEELQDGLESAGFKLDVYGSLSNNLPKLFDMWGDKNTVDNHNINSNGWIKI